MSRIRGKNTTPELRVRSLLHRLGYRFRLQVRIPVPPLALNPQPSSPRVPPSSIIHHPSTKVRYIRPDIILPKHKTVIFVHGCFWHRHRGCKNCTTPTNRRQWWLKKLEGNAARDRLHQRALKKLGWRSLVVWECQTEKPKSLKKLANRAAAGQL